MNLSKIKDIAKDQGKTLGSVAAAVGITHAGLNTLMKENSTRVDTLLKIANYLGVPITEFLDEDDMRVPAPAYGNSATVGDRSLSFFICKTNSKTSVLNFQDHVKRSISNYYIIYEEFTHLKKSMFLLILK